MDISNIADDIHFWGWQLDIKWLVDVLRQIVSDWNSNWVILVLRKSVNNLVIYSLDLSINDWSLSLNFVCSVLRSRVYYLNIQILVSHYWLVDLLSVNFASRNIDVLGSGVLAEFGW